jgi:hypothetical protein
LPREKTVYVVRFATVVPEISGMIQVNQFESTVFERSVCKCPGASLIFGWVGSKIDWTDLRVGKECQAKGNKESNAAAYSAA